MIMKNITKILRESVETKHTALILTTKNPRVEYSENLATAIFKYKDLLYRIKDIEELNDLYENIEKHLNDDVEEYEKSLEKLNDDEISYVKKIYKLLSFKNDNSKYDIDLQRELTSRDKKILSQLENIDKKNNVLKNEEDSFETVGTRFEKYVK